MNKNLVIGILAALLVMGSLWGQIGNKSKKVLQREREALATQLSQVEAEAVKAHDALLAKTANLQKTLQVKAQQLAKARHELVGLRKGGKALEAQISERDAAVIILTQEKNRLAGQINKMKKSQAATEAAVTTLTQEKNRLAGQINKMKKSLAATAGSGQQQVAALQAALQEKEQQLAAATEAIEETRAVKKELHSFAEQEAQNTEVLQAKLDKAEVAVQQLQGQLAVAEAAADQSGIAREYESVRSQLIGLEKIVEEKNATIEETSKELDRWKVNMDVLLTRISEQQDTQQELREENRELVKELAAKNEELADVNEQLIQTPVLQ